jgi:hypothetical protein
VAETRDLGQDCSLVEGLVPLGFSEVGDRALREKRQRVDLPVPLGAV